MRGTAQEYTPPYRICLDNKLIMVTINPNLSLTRCQALSIELEEYLTGTPRVLFDFWTTSSLDDPVLAEIDKLITSIENISGMVKAVSRSQSFVDSVEQGGRAPSIAAVIRYFLS